MRYIFHVLLITAICLTASSGSNAQDNLGFQWQRTFGGSNNNVGLKIVKTADGGFIIAGWATDNNIYRDVWIMKFNSTGALEWDRKFGGSGTDEVAGIIQSKDGGYIFIANSNSTDGDVMGNHGLFDIWVVKLSATGNILWQRSVGGSAEDFGLNLVELKDGEVAIGAKTKSADGNVLGKKDNSFDAWLVVLNASGNTFFGRRLYGGSADENVVDFRQTKDGGFIFMGFSESIDGDFISTVAQNNLFLIKIADNSNIIFARKINTYDAGSPQLIRPGPNGGYYLAGEATNSRISSVTKLNDVGEIVWHREYLLPQADEHAIFSICFTPDNSGIYIAGRVMHTGPLTPPDKAFIGRLDTVSGSMRLYKAYNYNGRSGGVDIIIGGDGLPLITGFIETRPTAHPDKRSDVLLLKYGSTNIIKGAVFFDRNRNGIKDANESDFDNVVVKSQKQGWELSARPFNGRFSLDTDTGTYTTSVQPRHPYFNVVPASKNSVFTTYSNIDSFSFAVQPIPGKRNLSISAVPLNIPRPGFKMSCRIYYRNNGTDTITSGEILFKKDSRLIFLSAAPNLLSISGDTLKWSYSNLQPLDTASILVNLQLPAPPALNIDDTLVSFATITPVTGDLVPVDDTAHLDQPVRGSYDPNDKTENLAGQISKRELSSNNYINYLIRFQNTGNDTAFTISARDTLDDKLDWSSLEMIASSHPYQLNIKSQNKLTWTFSNILLVDSFRNEPASHGFIAYRIKAKNSLSIGDVIKNTASIYFDYNLPVKTNTQETEVIQYKVNDPQLAVPTISSFTPATATSGTVISITGTYLTGATSVSFGGIAASSFTVNSSTSISAVVGTGGSGNVSVMTPGGTATLAGFIYIPAPTVTSFTPASGGSGTLVTITGTNLTGATGVSFGGVNATSFTVNSATSITAVVGTGSSGSVSVTTPGGTETLAGFTYTIVTAIDPIPSNSLGIHFFPNPTSGSFTIDTLKLADQWETLEILDARGKQKLLSINIRSKTTVNVNLKHFSSGMYIALLRRKNGRPTSIKFIKQ